MPDNTALPHTPKAALENYIHAMGSVYDVWYETAVARHLASWLTLQIVAVLAGVVTAIIAALHGDQPLGPWTRAAFIVLPILAGVASPFVVVFRNLMRLREAGRQRIQYLIEHGTVRFAAATAPAEHSEIHAWLVEQVSALEADQSQRFYQVVPEQLAFGKGTPPELPTERPH